MPDSLSSFYKQWLPSNFSAIFANYLNILLPNQLLSISLLEITLLLLQDSEQMTPFFVRVNPPDRVTNRALILPFAGLIGIPAL